MSSAGPTVVAPQGDPRQHSHAACVGWSLCRRRGTVAHSSPVLHTIVHHAWFDRVVLVAVLANSVCLALDQPLADQGSPRQQTLAVLDKVRCCKAPGLACL